MSNYNTTLQSNNTDLQAILNTINELPEAVEQATPVISVNNSNGLITATAGAKSSTHQLAFQAAKTITPSTASQIAVSSGYYTGGNITVAGDSNLIAGNIKSGVSIFGVNGNYEGSGGDTSVEDGLITRTPSFYTNNRIVYIGSYAFYSYYSLTRVTFPNVTRIDSYAFANCTNLATVSLPQVTRIGSSAFYRCFSLTTVSLPQVTTIDSGAFANCTRLTTIDFPNATSIGSSAFILNYSLATVSLPQVTRISSSTFYNCSNLATVSLPKVTIIDDYAFARCSKLATVNLPQVTRIGSSAFASNYGLTTVSLPMCKSITGNYAFWECYMLKSLYLTSNRLCNLSNSNAFSSTPIGGYSTSAGTYGSIYVPASLLSFYKKATNWTYFSSRFVGI